ncbi:MAG: hypothetical protein ABJA37_06465 [Ferruginibacter sp.]
MKLLLSLAISILLSSYSCNHTKTKDSNTAKDTVVEFKINEAPAVKTVDSLQPQKVAVDIVKEEEAKEPVTSKTVSEKFPACIKNMIEGFEKEERQNPPRSVYSYSYSGKTVYYVPAVCCDNFSDLYDANCKLIAHPDGGFTGKGDGKLPDFIRERTREKVLWRDERK